MISTPPSEAFEWDVVQTVEWIVFRGRRPIVFRHQNEETGWSTFEVFRALEARAKGDPRSWRPPAEREGYAPAWMARALARRWMRAEGLTAQEMLSKLEDPNAKWVSMADAAEVERLNMKALADLNDAARRGLIKARGRPSQGWQAAGDAPPRERVPSDFIDETRSIDWSGSLERHGGDSGFDWLHDEGPFYHDIRFRAAKVKRVWPQPDPVGHFDLAPPAPVAELQKLWETTPEADRIGHKNTVIRLANERTLQAWLEDKMRASPHAGPGKRRVWEEVRALYSGSRASFDRSFAAAVRATGAAAWSTAGAKRKANR